MGEGFGVELAFFEGVVCDDELSSESEPRLSARFLLDVWPELIEEVIARWVRPFLAVLGDWQAINQ